MRKVYAFCAATTLALTALAATSPAQAGFHLIRWNGTGVCQVWDNSVPTKPFPADYKTVSKSQATFTGALAVKDGLLKKGTCKL